MGPDVRRGLEQLKLECLRVLNDQAIHEIVKSRKRRVLVMIDRKLANYKEPGKQLRRTVVA